MLRRITSIPRRVGRWLFRRIVGPPSQLPQRTLTAAFIACIAIAVAGAWYGVRSGIQIGGGSLPYIRPILLVLRSTWTYVILLVLICWRILLFRNRRYAYQSSERTGYGVQTIRRLAEEVKTTDATNRVIVTSEDSAEDAADRISEKLREGDDDVFEFDPVGASDEDEDAGTPDVGDLHDATEALDVALEELSDEQLLARHDALHEAAEERQADLLTAEFSAEKILDADGAVAPKDLIEDGDERTEEFAAIVERIEEVEAEMDRRIDDLPPEPWTVTAGESAVERVEKHWLRRTLSRFRPVFVGVWTALMAFAVVLLAWIMTQPEPTTTMVAAIGTASAGFGAAVGLVDAVQRRVRAWVSQRRPDPIPYPPADGDDDHQTGDWWREEWELLKLDIGSTLDASELFWTLLVPAGITFAVLLVLVRFWTNPYLYPAMATGALAVGILNYVRVLRKRRRRLQKLRQTHDLRSWNAMGVLAKRVETAETQMYIGWLSGRVYAHPDRETFAREVGHRAHEAVNGVPISPSILEKYARQLRQLYPDLNAFRDQEKYDIMERLRDRIADSSTGLVPKALLIEEVVEHDIEQRRLGSGTKGKGHDPGLVRECYRELIEAGAFVEQEIAVAPRAAPSEEDGRERVVASSSKYPDDAPTVTAVRFAGDTLPPEYGQIRAQFAGRFSNYARWDPIYELPDVDDILDRDPEVMSSLVVRDEDVDLDVDEHGRAIADGGIVDE